jgi:hypothetical protein
LGWGFRKSVTVGGVRFTFSKSGVSTSVGGKGFRVTSGPRGVYVTTGFGGFYYRQRLGGHRPGPPARPPASADRPEPHFYATESFGSTGVEHLTDVTQDEFVSGLNEWTRRGALQLIAALGAAVAIVIALAASASNRAVGEIAVYGLIAFLLARFVENRRRRFVLVYDLGVAESKRYQQLADALADLASSGKFRAVKMIGHHHDWKRNAGATRSMSFEAASLRASVPPHIITNIVPWTLRIQGMELSFFPDRILIRSGGRFAALSYQALEVDAYLANFVWDESVPRDAQIIGQTWLYVRRDGGPDRRFSGNRQIPIVRTAYLTFKSATGLEAVVQTTRISAAERWERAAPLYARETDRQAQVPSTLDPELRQAVSTLGLLEVPSPAELKRVYHELAQRNHPDRFARGPREIRELAEQRMREINDAYALLRTKGGPQRAGDDSNVSIPVASTVSSAPRRIWQSAEAIAVLVAIIVAGVAFAGFRSAPAEAESEVLVASTPTAPMVTETAPVPVTTPPQRRRIETKCPLRDMPSPKGKQLATVRKATEVVVLAKHEVWLRVRDDAGHEGWAGPKCWQLGTAKTKAKRRRDSDASDSAGAKTPVDPPVKDPAVEPEPAERQPNSNGPVAPDVVDPFDR